MDYDCIVIGAGRAGLTSALKLAAAGKKVIVLEKQPVPGGVATSFKRKGFIFESALHFVDALADKEDIRGFLDEYGVSEKINFIELKEFGRVIYPQHDFVVKNDFDSLKERLKSSFPAEEEGVEEFFKDINKFYRHFDGFAYSEIPLWLKMFLLPFLYPLVIKASCVTLEQFMTKRIKDKRVRGILGSLWGFIGLPPCEVSAFFFLIVMRGYWGAKTAYVKGGFSSLFNAMVARIRECGCEVRFNTTVREIVTDGGKCIKAVRIDNGEELKAGAVISNANAIDTLTRIIDSETLKEAYAKKLSGIQKSVSAVIVYLGLDVPSGALGMNYPLMLINATYDHDASFKNCIDGDYRNCSLAVVSHTQLDPGLAPQGKSTICVMTLDSYANWDKLTAEEYQKRKKEVAGTIIAHLENYLPGVSGHIEDLEVATPRTMERFGSLPQGAIYGFAQTVAQASVNRLSQNTAIKGLFLAGAWTKPGCGVHGCLVSGQDAADLALRYLR